MGWSRWTFGRAVLVASAFGAVGCVDEADTLTIATPWTSAGRAKVDDAFRRLAPPHPSRLRWLLLAPGDDLTQVARRKPAPDLIIGGPASVYAAMEDQELLEPSPDGGPGWRVAGRSAVADRPLSASGDPRRDPGVLARAKAVLETSPTWAEGYARLVRSGGTRIEPALENVEGATVVRGSRHADAARALVRALAETGQEATRRGTTLADAMLADLLGAALVEAGDELREARRELDTAGHPRVPEMWMAQPPPWPPASVAQILGRESNAMALLETLATQVAPEADVRSWLLRSWLAPARLVDDRLLAELAGAARGRLAHEPRFRAWLRSEWRAWARQRYRRVARLAKAAKDTSS